MMKTKRCKKSKEYSVCPWCLQKMECFMCIDSYQWYCRQCARTYYLCCPCLGEHSDGLFSITTDASGHICTSCMHYYCASHIGEMGTGDSQLCLNCKFKLKKK